MGLLSPTGLLKASSRLQLVEMPLNMKEYPKKLSQNVGIILCNNSKNKNTQNIQNIEVI